MPEFPVRDTGSGAGARRAPEADGDGHGTLQCSILGD